MQNIKAKNEQIHKSIPPVQKQKPIMSSGRVSEDGNVAAKPQTAPIQTEIKKRLPLGSRFYLLYIMKSNQIQTE